MCSGMCTRGCEQSDNIKRPTTILLRRSTFCHTLCKCGPCKLHNADMCYIMCGYTLNKIKAKHKILDLLKEWWVWVSHNTQYKMYIPDLQQNLGLEVVLDTSMPCIETGWLEVSSWKTILSIPWWYQKDRTIK